MTVVGIDHVQLAMPAGREDDARAFYAGLLGLDEVPKPEPLAARGGCWFESGSVSIHLGVEDDFRPARKAHVALLLTDLSALVDRLRAAGVELAEAEPLDGYERIHAFDVFGNRLELMQPTGSLDAAHPRATPSSPST